LKHAFLRGTGHRESCMWFAVLLRFGLSGTILACLLATV
jgi:hypothetical protein